MAATTRMTNSPACALFPAAAIIVIGQENHDCAGAGSPGKATDAAAAGSITAPVASEHQPARQARSRKAA